MVDTLLVLLEILTQSKLARICQEEVGVETET